MNKKRIIGDSFHILKYYALSKKIALSRRYTEALEQRKKKKNKVRQRRKTKKTKIKKPRKTAWSKKS